MLILPEGQTGVAWEPSKKECSFGYGGVLDRKVLLLHLPKTPLRQAGD
jgi:hypothetical protein